MRENNCVYALKESPVVLVCQHFFNCQMKQQQKIIYANVYRNTVNNGDSQTSLLPIFSEVGGRLYTGYCKFNFSKYFTCPSGKLKTCRIHQHDSKIHQPWAIGHYFLCTLEEQLCLVTSLTLMLHELEIRQLHTRWQIHSKTVFIKKYIDFTVTTYILQARSMNY